MYLINGELHADFDLDTALTLLHQALPHHLSTPLQRTTVLTAAAKFAQQLHSIELPLDNEQRQALIDFCQPHALQTNLNANWVIRPIRCAASIVGNRASSAGAPWVWWST